ncbi:AfsR/SARP family transcriptional regulator [Allokutzneria albata]|uniref:Transcriptional activator domain-containing protein n=1 Tax=Allokutzneria albata TaxID=211114 RepID=A0A1G9RBK0_ALLAB|nr:BTAD domain-containing putative transcriptional regulator [Allokutzneria albata]SDM19765.1 transcriptional activator domain-containing protein [Allokutzneria albata]
MLGELETSTGSASVVVGTPQRRLVLAALLTRVNRWVPLDDITRLLWPADLPRAARSAVHKHVSLLRTAFQGVDEVRIDRHGSGYALRTDPARIDAFRFRDLVEEARWRAWEDCVDIELRLGAHRRLVPELTELVARHRDRARMAGQLSLALHRSRRHCVRWDMSMSVVRAVSGLAGVLARRPPAQIRKVLDRLGIGASTGRSPCTTRLRRRVLLARQGKTSYADR